MRLRAGAAVATLASRGRVARKSWSIVKRDVALLLQRGRCIEQSKRDQVNGLGRGPYMCIGRRGDLVHFPVDLDSI